MQVLERTDQWKFGNLTGEKLPSVALTKVGVSVGMKNDPVLLVRQSLLGEESPTPVPLPTNTESLDGCVRYDWLLAASGIGPSWWDWTAPLGQSPALKCQLHIEAGPQSSFTEVSAGLVALTPSRHQQSWMEEMRGRVTALPGALEGVPYAGRAAGFLAPLVANLIPSPENWWIYRCLDPVSQRLMIEWNITKKVLEEYGPAVRGVLILMFHGHRPTGSVRFWPTFCFRNDSLASHGMPDRNQALELFLNKSGK